MEETASFQDWELLPSTDATGISSPHSPDKSNQSGSTYIDSEDGAIKHDYFSLDSENRSRQPIRDPSEEESEEGGVESDNPSWIDPDSDSRYPNRPRGQICFARTGYARSNSDGFWSDESSDGLAESEKSENFGGDGVEGIEGVATEQENLDELGGDDSSELVRTGREGANGLPIDEGGRKEVAWWKMPVDFLKFCVFRVRPVWAISIVAAFMGVAIMGRRLYKMKQRSRSIPHKITLDDKKVSQFMVRAARLNEAFSVVRRVPLIRPALSASGGVTPWSVASLR